MTTSVAATTAGAVVGVGVVVAALGLRAAPVSRRRPSLTRRHGAVLRGQAARIGAALAVGLVVVVVTRRPVTGPLVALAVWGVPVLFTAGRAAARQVARVEAVEDWVRRLADVLVVGVGLGQAITATARSAPEPIRGPVERLASRLSAHWSVEDALRAFAAELDDPAADLAAAALVLAHRRRGPGLAAALTAIADALAEQVAMRRRIEADRAKPRATARAVTVVTLLVVGLGLTTGGYLAPYGTPLGSLVLLAVAALFTAALAWLHALTTASVRLRMLAPPAGWGRTR